MSSAQAVASFFVLNVFDRLVPLVRTCACHLPLGRFSMLAVAASSAGLQQSSV